MTRNRASVLLEKLGGTEQNREGSTQGLDQTLQLLALNTAKLLDSDHCSIMMSNGRNLQVYAHYGDLPDAAYGEAVKKGQGISGHVFATGQALLIEDIDQSEYASSAMRHTRGKSLMSAPILIDGLPTGVINVHGPCPTRMYDHNDLNTLKIISILVGRTVQVSQLQSILHSRFATLSLATKQRQSRAEILANPAQDPGKLAKILAKSFYRELRRAGFGSAQIINAASEIISELGTSLRKRSP